MINRSVKLIASLALLFLCASNSYAIDLLKRPPIDLALVQSTQGRPQGQNQQGLPPNKKRSLSNYGPEDVFPVEPEQNEVRNQGSRAPSRSASRSRTSTTVPNPTSMAPPVISERMSLPATPDPLATPADPATPATPTPTAAVAVSSLGQPQSLARPQTNAGPPTDVRWMLGGLALASVVIFTALVYVLFKLKEKLREGNR